MAVDLPAVLARAEARLSWPRLVPPDERWVAPDEEVLTALREAEAPLVLAGPGVVRDGAIPGLQALAVAGSLGVLNTWGAKGVFDWRSRHHLVTVGLQARDADLSGVHDCDLLVCVGIDDAEAEPARWRRAAAVVDVPSGALAPLAEAWWRSHRDVVMPPLRDRLAAATQAGWAVTGSPLAPSQVTRNYGEIVAAGGTVAADPGVAGYWVARTLGTTRPGAVHVPADADAAGFAVACALVARRRRPDAPALAVVDTMTPAVEEALAWARSSGVVVALEVWDPDGAQLDADEHRERLGALLRDGGVAHLAPRLDQLDAMVEAAGPITAWGGLLG